MTNTERNEEALIASLLYEIKNPAYGRHTLDACHQLGLTENDFNTDKFKQLYIPIAKEAPGDPLLDYNTLKNRLYTSGWLKKYGEKELARIYDTCCSIGHDRHYAMEVLDLSRKRKIAELSRRAIGMCGDDAETSSQACLWETIGKLMQLDKPFRPPESIATCVKKATEEINRIIDDGFTCHDGLSTGYEGFDNLLMGMKPGIIIIAGRPSVGKTSLAENIAQCVATGRTIDGRPLPNGDSEPHRVIFISLEMRVYDLTKRKLLGIAEIDQTRAGKRLLNSKDKKELKDRLKKAAEMLSDPDKIPIDPLQPESNDINDIWSMLRRKFYECEAKGKGRPALVIIDYLQLMECREAKSRDRQNEVSTISRRLKHMSTELGVPVIALSQLSRANEMRGEKESEPRLSDLRDSGAIEQDADVVILLSRKETKYGYNGSQNTPLLINANVAKNRNGQIGNVTLEFQPQFTKFKDHKEQQTSTDRADPDPDSNSESIDIF